MPTKLPRLNVVMEPDIYKSIEKLAKQENLSLSQVAKDLIKEALLLNEDGYWEKEAVAREKSIKKKKLISHKEIWD